MIRFKVVIGGCVIDFIIRRISKFTILGEYWASLENWSNFRDFNRINHEQDNFLGSEGRIGRAGQANWCNKAIFLKFREGRLVWLLISYLMIGSENVEIWQDTSCCDFAIFPKSWFKSGLGIISFSRTQTQNNNTVVLLNHFIVDDNLNLD